MTAKGTDGSVVIGTTRLGEMYGRSWTWARNLLVRWHEEQKRGGPVRVFVSGKKNALHTTLAILQREMPPARDQVLVRKLKEHERDLDRLARRVDELTTQVNMMSKKLESKSGVRLTG